MQAEQVLGGTRSTRGDAEVLADQSVISHYRRLTGRDTGSTSSSAAGPGGSASKQRPIEGECAVCYDTLKVGCLFQAEVILARSALFRQTGSLLSHRTVRACSVQSVVLIVSSCRIHLSCFCHVLVACVLCFLSPAQNFQSSVLFTRIPLTQAAYVAGCNIVLVQHARPEKHASCCHC